jgi:hypothetical protein
MSTRKGFGAFAKNSAVKEQHRNPQAKVNGSRAQANQELGPLGRVKRQRPVRRGIYTTN